MTSHSSWRCTRRCCALSVTVVPIRSDVRRDARCASRDPGAWTPHHRIAGRRRRKRALPLGAAHLSPWAPRQQLGRSGSSGGGISWPVIAPGTLLVWRRRQPAKFGHGPSSRGSRSATGGACRHPCWRRTGQPARRRPLPEHRTQEGQRLARPRTPHPPRPAGAGGRTPRPRRPRPAPPALATRTCSATSSPSCAACQRWKGRSRTSSAGWRPQDGPWTRRTTGTEKPNGRAMALYARPDVRACRPMSKSWNLVLGGGPVLRTAAPAWREDTSVPLSGPLPLSSDRVRRESSA